MSLNHKSYRPELSDWQQEPIEDGQTKPAVKIPDYLDLNFSTRELDILRLVMKEYTCDEIAEELFISKRTVEAHRRRIIHKSGCRNMIGVVLQAIKYNVLSANDCLAYA